MLRPAVPADDDVRETQPARRPGSFLAAASLLCATAWLISRVFVGLDFSDEMQYYGELASLTRTGKFFQVDLFVQQVGYVFLYPFFKLHAVVFPDLSHLVLFGRLLLLGGYGLAGRMFWRTAGKLGGFPTAAKLAGLAALFAWVPFQIFSPSYNSISYLLVAGTAAAWLNRDPIPRSSQTASLAAFLVVLTFTYPTAGVGLIAVVVAEAGWRQGARPALKLTAVIALGGALVTGAIFAIHGASFGRDLIDAVRFSRAFGVGSAVMEWNHLAALAAMLLAGLLFIRRMHLDRPLRYPLGAGTSSPLRWATMGILLASGAVLVALMAKWETGYFASAAFQVVLMLLAVSIGPADEGRGPESVEPLAHARSHGYQVELKLMRRIMIAALIIGSGALLAITGIWATGYFAPSIYTVLFLLAAILGRSNDRRAMIELAVAGTLLGAVFSFSSGNGVHNFGIGVAGLIPFLVLLVGRQVDASRFAVRLPLASHAVLPGLVVLILLNAARNPFREERGWKGFKPANAVPAFMGIWTSPTKIEAIERFQTLAGSGGLAHKRILVAGPHPWLYFLIGGQPATPMFFMHFSWSEQVYEQVAERLFQGGPPDVIVVANGLPRPIHARVMAWAQQGCVVKNITLPAEFTARYEQMTRYPIGTDVLVLSRR